MSFVEWFESLSKLEIFGMSILLGMAIWFSIQNFILNDDRAIWLAKRENGLKALYWPSIVVLLIGLYNLVVYLNKSIVVTWDWDPVSVEPWVLVFVLVGAVFFVLRRIQKLRNQRPAPGLLRKIDESSIKPKEAKTK
jgi:hypothetical protein